ncbi:MAG TPA: hypothetical protein VNG32_04160 [Candidatus Dormibacteraeota bacterium]|nr:hypothetical protein [Candidatus Dormibacteraeota bacterium]
MRIPLYADGTAPELDSDPPIRQGLRALKDSAFQEKMISVIGAKRGIGEHDALRIGQLVSESLERLDRSDLAKLTILKVLGASLVTSNEAALAYTKAYSVGKDPKLLKRFNRSVRQSIESVNQARPLVFASLGEICIFGMPATSPGRRYIGPVIEEGSQDLEEERQVFLKPLIPQESSRLLNQFNDGHVHHLSLLSTTSEHSAQQAAESLDMEDIAGMWVSLLGAQAITRDIILESPS